MSKGGKSGRNGATIIIKKEEIVEGGHHGGAWKVAYADFVTAMMAFFLLMWLLNATTEDQRRGLADYFAPNGAMSHQTSGSGAPFGGRTPFDTGSLVSDRGAMSITVGKATAMVAPDDADSPTSSQMTTPRMMDDDGEASTAQLSSTPRLDPNATDGAQAKASPVPDDAEAGRASGGSKDSEAARERRDGEAQEKARQQRMEQQAFERAADQIRDAVRADPALAVLAKQLAIDLTPEGLRIQLLDEDRQAMFPSGSSVPNERARLLLQKIAPVLAKLSEPIAITGHTDAQVYRGTDKSNWDLSSERANVTRRVLSDAGLQDARVRSVSGAADRDLLLPADPFAAANRRIAIVVLRSGRPGEAPRTEPAAAQGVGEASRVAQPPAAALPEPNSAARREPPRAADPARPTQPILPASRRDAVVDAPRNEGARPTARLAAELASTAPRSARADDSSDEAAEVSPRARASTGLPAPTTVLPSIVRPAGPGRRSPS